MGKDKDFGIESGTGNAQGLQELIIKRSSIKGRITKFRNFLINVQSKESLTPVDLTEINLKLSKFEELSNKFEDLQSQIEILNCNTLSEELDERDDIEQLFITNIASARNIIRTHQSSTRHDEGNHNLSNFTPASGSPVHQEVSFKLPQIQISKFDGAYFRWLEFRDTFLSLIHNNDRIASIHKFHYLISYLEGDASRIISNLEVSSANYQTAWSLLCERYDNKRQLINHHLNSLLNIQQIVRESDRSLRFLVDHITKNLRALSSLGLPTDKWDVLIIHILCSKLDNHTLTKWEEWRSTLEDIPSLQQFNKFLIDRADVLGSLSRSHSNTNNKSSVVNPTKFSTCKGERSQTKSFVSGQDLLTCTSFICTVCQGNHRIYDCPCFKAKSVQERIAHCNKLNLCRNCLRYGHNVKDCRLGPCRECKKRHNTLLHIPVTKQLLATNESSEDTIVSFSQHSSKYVLLSTALIENPGTNYKERVRALLDCGSQSSFISKTLQNKLSLSTNSLHNNLINVVGIGNNITNTVSEFCTAQLKSLNSNFSITSNFLVLSQITGKVPKFTIDVKKLQIPDTMTLADPNFNKSAAIEVLIGADMFWDILGCDQHSLGQHKPTLRSSQFGWLISGPINTNNKSGDIKCHLATSSNDFNQKLTKFWELEEVPLKSSLSEDEKLCEKHFLSHTVRLENGRFSVSLPLKASSDCLGDSYYLAKKRLLNLENKFKKHPHIKSQYVNFIKEYEELGHLTESNFLKPNISYFLCHHAVFKDSSESTKIRVVFDGSAPTSSGMSVNDILMVGPNIQDSLFSILVRARQYKYLLSGDIEKMYRQIEVNEEHRDLQLVLWREDESLPIRTLRLNTVTYGMASSSYLSTRCLWQIGDECTDQLIKTIIQHDFYVDDLITGSDDEHTLKYIHKNVTAALRQGCFNLRKFKTNLPSIFDTSSLDFSEKLTLSESSNTLGLGWDPSTDTLHIPIQISSSYKEQHITKRAMLSNLFKIFDPLGLLSPCVIPTKVMLQQLWLAKVGWDDAIPKDISKAWNKFNKLLPILSTIKIPRRVLCDLPMSIELHSFCDASQSAYGACIYLRTINSANQVTVNLLCSKSKVAPIKPTTIPRLELCAAVLAARLCSAVKSSLRFKVHRESYWCDSTIVLRWLHVSFRDLKSFVANRITEICDLTDRALWRHIATSNNPADLISRGLSPDHIKHNSLWWSGPSFLSQPENTWPILGESSDMDELPEIKLKSTISNVTVIKESFIHFDNYSSFPRLKRILAYIKRFIINLKRPKEPILGPLSINETNAAFLDLCMIVQQQSFAHEYDLLSRNKPLSPKSHILSLSPFFAKDKLIRVGGRLQASDFPYDKKHPILLHVSHKFTKLIFEHEHRHNLHCGPQLLLSIVREYIWPVNGRILARQTVQKCITCQRLRGKTLQPIMGNLPSQRVTPNFPFRSVGIDFAGPFLILNRKGRGSKLIKCYLCLFVCLRYKCMHLEAVSDLTKDSFVLTFRRFVSRRGKPAEVFCDNGRNFVGASKEFNHFLKSHSNSLSDFAREEGVNFIFSPSYAPHFGGIWEAGVKSAKYHLKRVMGNAHLTFEELSTLFAHVEAILNSRPLYPLSSSPDDFLCLTPGHFLIGRALNALPSPQLEESNSNNLQRYMRLEQIHQHFWRRWQLEYISEMQQRSKWRTSNMKINIGDLVLLKEDHVPPLCWRLGRIQRLFTGSDLIPRVADVNTQRGVVRRPLVRLCPLGTASDIQC